ncbi:anti-sigma factor family protein [Georgenia sp. AZ-5]|uniref:anti-sigma factor family protein n=1 Tax=Georgenia sp. AZ-5 TaxID=3367526 RepID=UPI0037550730
MSHLGDDVSALVDGQLPPERAEEALAHLVTCDVCAAEVAAERASRRRLSQARDVPPSTELTSRLIGLASRPPEPPRGGWAGRAWEPLADPRARHRLVTRSGLALAGAAGVVGTLLVVGTLAERPGNPTAMLAQVTGPDGGETELVLSPSSVFLESGPDVDTTRAALAWLEEHDWAAPRTVPDELHVSALESVETAAGETLIELELVGQGHQVTVVQQRGVLDAASVAHLPAVDLGKAQGYEVPVPGTALVMQCDDVVTLVASRGPEALVRAVAAELPVTAPGSGMADRLGLGWQTLVGWTDLIGQNP